MQNRVKYARMIVNILIPILWMVLLVTLGPEVLNFFMPFVIGWIIAMIANPLVKFLEKKLKIVRKHSSMVVIIAALALVIAAIYLIVSRVSTLLLEFTKDLPELYDIVLKEVGNAANNLEHLLRFLPNGIQEALETFTQNLGSAIGEVVKKIAAPTVEVAGNVAKKIPNAFIYSVITVLSAYSFIAERDRILAIFKTYAPRSIQKYFNFLKMDIKKVVGGYFMAQFKIMFVVALILTVGFWLLRISYAPLFAILISILDFLPFFGTGTALIPWAAIKFFSGEYEFAIGLIIIYAVSQIVRQVIQPKIVGDSFGLHPLITLLFLYMGFRINGIAGMILAVPIGLILINFYKYGAFDSFLSNLTMLIEEIQKIRFGKEYSEEDENNK